MTSKSNKISAKYNYGKRIQESSRRNRKMADKRKKHV